MKVLSTTILFLALMTTINAQAKGIKQDNNLNCLTKVIYTEARGEDYYGQIAVGNVVMNRLENWNYKNICSVVYDGNQFSDIRTVKVREKDAWADCLIIAKQLYNNQLEDITNGATYFHALRVKPNWRKSKNLKSTVTYGKHKFYREITEEDEYKVNLDEILSLLPEFLY